VSSVTECKVRVTAANETSETVVLVRPTVVKSVVIAPISIVGGANGTVTITLTEAAPIGGLSVTLESSSAKFPVPAAVSIPAGKTSGVVTVLTSATSSTENVVVTSNLGGAATSGTVTVVPVALASFTAAPASVKAGGSIVITVKLAAVSAVPVDVVMSTTDAALLPIPAIITVPAGQLTLQQVITVGATVVKKAVVLKASTQSVPKQVTVSVNP
jgi:hypothetical protein